IGWHGKALAWAGHISDRVRSTVVAAFTYSHDVMMRLRLTWINDLTEQTGQQGRDRGGGRRQGEPHQADPRCPQIPRATSSFLRREIRERQGLVARLRGGCLSALPQAGAYGRPQDRPGASLPREPC